MYNRNILIMQETGLTATVLLKYFDCHILIIMSFASIIMFSWGINDTSKTTRMTIIGDATTRCVILMTLEVSFMIVTFLLCRTGLLQLYTIKIF